MTFIVLEGIDGSGTTSQAQYLVEKFKEKGLDVVTTFEPSSGEIGKFIRSLFTRKDLAMPKWDTMALLFSADRLHHIDTVIAPALEDDKIVICERYDYSTIGYQVYSALDFECFSKESYKELAHNGYQKWIEELNKFAYRPDITFVLSISAKTARERMGKSRRDLDQFEKKVQLQEHLASYYANLSEFFPHDNIYTIDAEQSKEAVTNELCALLQKEGVLPV